MNKLTEIVFELYDLLIIELIKSKESLSVKLHGINMDDAFYLDVIFNKQPMRPSEFAQHINVTKPAATQLIHKYERLGLLNRILSQEDKRSFFIELKSDINESFKLAYSIFDASITKHINCLNKDEQNLLITLLKKITHEMTVI